MTKSCQFSFYKKENKVTLLFLYRLISGKAFYLFQMAAAALPETQCQQGLCVISL
jgi:hypothetical protein